MKAATLKEVAECLDVTISIHAAREGGDRLGTILKCSLCISIHAAREGGDITSNEVFRDIAISIHAAREGGDGICACVPYNRRHFNPRRP